MATPTTLPPKTAADKDTREQRGLALYREQAAAIRFDASERVWLVPSQHDSTSVYEVSLRRGGRCECKDWEYRGGPCVHVYAATVAKAKSAKCSGCGERHPRRELVEVGPERA